MHFFSVILAALPLVVYGVPQRAPTTSRTVGPAPTTSNTVRPTPTPSSTIVVTPTASNSTIAPTSTAAPEPPVFEVVFRNLTAAINAPGFLTFTLVDTVADCESFCNSVEGCVFLNAFNDVNGKNTTLLTCSVYDTCHNATEATNVGGQTEPDGSVNFIRNSTAECKA
ncbi:hypothetical protein K435DRAFT_972389 [Dendrothele bispora CBS 962.96]|uniref:Apple domain-containing protein n=1 Tax=Dendrothele bispora (strain CBS 962.96) TaxID=1314807 RepID=A0A4S8KZ28_DENBC|nr:hypothetical protein K435DRAFT_972389 [Dendrothele bispora CBS 962.96]